MKRACDTYLSERAYICSRCHKEASTLFLVHGEALCPTCLSGERPRLIYERMQNALAVSRTLCWRANKGVHLADGRWRQKR